MRNQIWANQQRRKNEAGFSLVELLFAAAIFTIIGGATLALFAQHMPVFNQQQNLAEVNIGLRNAIAQMQLDISNAGANYYPGINIPNYPVGVVVANHVVASGGDCRTGSPLAYSSTCFDSFTIISGDSSTPPTNPSTSTGGCVSTETTSATDIYLGPSGSATGYASAALATAAALKYKNGDQLLLVNNAGSSYTTIQLSADATTGTVNGFTNRFIKLPVASHTKTDLSLGARGMNASGSSPDPYDMTTHDNAMLDDSFCSTDWVLRLTPIQYSVDISDPTNPTLTRTVAGVVQTLAQKTLATQIVGFKVGVSLFNNATDTTTYQFDNSSYNNGSAVPYNYTLVRSVMVSLIGRTKPVTDPTYKFRNSFDAGAYEVQGVSVVVNPRNMSMED